MCLNHSFKRRIKNSNFQQNLSTIVDKINQYSKILFANFHSLFLKLPSILRPFVPHSLLTSSYWGTRHSDPVATSLNKINVGCLQKTSICMQISRMNYCYFNNDFSIMKLNSIYLLANFKNLVLTVKVAQHFMEQT